jgi:hypothetical protein
VNLGQFQPPTVFSEIFQGQLGTLRKIEEEDGTSENVHGQVFFFVILFFLFVSAH